MLQPKYAKQLDSNIKELLANGGSNEDVEKMASDYTSLFSDEALKKKDNSDVTATTQKLVSETSTGSLDGVGSNGFPAIDQNLGVPGLKPDLKTVEQLANPPKNKQSQEKTPEKRSFASEVFHKLATGSSQLGADIAATPELLYDAFAVPQNAIADYLDLPNLRTDSEKLKKTVGVRNAVKEFYQGEVKKLREQSALVDKKYEQGIYDSFKSGNYEDGFRQLTGSFAESLPASTSIMLGGAYAKAPQLLAASTMTFGAGKNEQLKDENPEMSNNARVANALGTGLAEGVFETIGTGSIGSAARAIVEREGAKKGFTVLKDGLADFYKEALKKNPLLASVSGEGVEEWATQVAQNSIDVATGAKPQDFNVFDGATDAFISGAFGGTVFGGGLKGLEKIANNQDKSTIKSNVKKTFELQKALENPNISEESKTEIHKAIDGLVKTNQKLIQKNVEHADNLDPKVKEKLADADTKIDVIKNKVKSIKLDGNTTDTQKQILLDGLKEDFKKNVDLKANILHGKTTVVDVLPLKEQDKIKRQALKELTAELNPDGKKNIEIDNAQIVERANKIYKAEQENLIKEKDAKVEIPITETEVKTEVQEPTITNEEKVSAETTSVLSENKAITPVEDVVATSVENIQNNGLKISGVTSIEFEDNNETILYGTKNNRTRISIKGMSKEQIQEEYDFDKQVFDKNKNRDFEAEEIEIKKSIGLTDNEKISALKELKSSKRYNDILEKITLPFYQTKLNESTPPTNTSTNGNVQSGTSNVGESGITEQQSPAKESVQSPNDVRASEAENEVNLEDIQNFINETYLNDEKSSTTTEADQGAVKNSNEENRAIPIGEKGKKQVKVTKEGKVSLQGRKALAKRQFKGDRKTASEIDPTDATSLALKYFVNGGKISSDYFNSQGERQARSNGLHGIAAKEAKTAKGEKATIDAVAHEIWESQENSELKLSTEDIKNAVEEVVNGNLTVQDAVASILGKYNVEEQNDADYEKDYAQAIQEYQQEENYSEEHIQEVESVLDYLSDAEIIELANSQEKSFDDYVKDIESRQVTYDLGPISEQGTIQPDGWILSENGELLSPKSVRNVKQVNPGVKAVEKPKTLVSKESPELKEVNAKLEKANENLRIAKDALDRKSKSLDKELLKDNEDLFGARKSQSENKLFDERVDADARNKATEKERNAISDAQKEIKALTEAKAKIESGEIVSTSEMNFEDKNKVRPKEVENPTNVGRMISASSRFRPAQRVDFEKPVIGPNGNKLVSYQWTYEWTEQPNREGELKPKRISDWDQAESSAATGRDIVHQFTIEKTNGETITVSSESVPFELGYAEKSQMKDLPSLVSAVKTLAKNKMKLAILEAQLKEYEDLKDKYQKIIPEIKEIKEPTNFGPVQEAYSNGEHKVFAIDDVWVRQSNKYNEKTRGFDPINSPDKFTIIFVKEDWVNKRVKENGGKFPRDIVDLRRRVERQEKKIGLVNSQEIDAKQQLKNKANAEVDRIAQKVKDLLPGIKDPNVKLQGISQDDLIDLVASAVKALISKGIDVNDAIRQVAASIKERFNVDVDENLVKAKLGVEKPKSKTKNPLREKSSEEISDELGISEKDYLDLKAFVANEPSSGIFNEYLSADTIADVFGDGPTNNQQYEQMVLLNAVQHGNSVLEKARSIFGENYMSKTLEFLQNVKLGNFEKAMVYAALENEIDTLVKANPSNKVFLATQRLIYADSQANLRNSSKGLNAGRLRRIHNAIKNGYDIDKLTSGLIKPEQQEAKQILKDAIPTGENLNNALEQEENTEVEKPRVYTQEEFEAELKKAVQASVGKSRNELSKKGKDIADKIRRLKLNKDVAKADLSLGAYDLAIEAIAQLVEKGATIAQAIKNVLGDPQFKDIDADKLRQDILGVVNTPRIKDVVKQALIDAGFSREITVTKNAKDENGNDIIKDGKKVKIKETKEVLDWNKLTGRMNSVEALRANVEGKLKEQGYTDSQIEEISNELEAEYKRLTEYIADKALTELERRNQIPKPVNRKSDLDRLVDYHNKGLFGESAKGYERLINKIVGITKREQDVLDKIEAEIEKIKNLREVKIDGSFPDAQSIESQASYIAKSIRNIIAWSNLVNSPLKLQIITVLSDIAGISRAAVLGNLYNAFQNIYSNNRAGFLARMKFKSKGYWTPELNDAFNELKNTVTSDVLLNRGLDFGDTVSPFSNHSIFIEKIKDYINKKYPEGVKRQRAIGILNTFEGRLFLNVMDSRFKSKIVNIDFVMNLVDVLTSERAGKSKMTKEEAVNFVSESLTGVNLEKAKVLAKKFIDDVNAMKEGTLLKNEDNIKRLAFDIVRENLTSGNNFTMDEINDIYQASMKSGGINIGHESNNIVSEELKSLNNRIEKKVEDAMKEKDFDKATKYATYAFISKNILYPYMSGGLNWAVLEAEAGTPLGLATGAYKSYKNKNIDLLTDVGKKRMKEDLINKRDAESKLFRGIWGTSIAISAYLAYYGLQAVSGIGDDDEENKRIFNKYLREHPEQRKIFDKFSPEVYAVSLATSDERLSKYLLNKMGYKTDQNDNVLTLVKSLQDKNSSSAGALGVLLGQVISTPGAWRILRDTKRLYKELQGEPMAQSKRRVTSFLNGYFKGGLVDYLGLRPDVNYDLEKVKKEIDNKKVDFTRYTNGVADDINSGKITVADADKIVKEKYKDNDKLKEKAVDIISKAVSDKEIRDGLKDADTWYMEMYNEKDIRAKAYVYYQNALKGKRETEDKKFYDYMDLALFGKDEEYITEFYNLAIEYKDIEEQSKNKPVN